MSQSKLFDYNSSFALTRTNPKLSGNYKITLDSSGGVWFNSIDANQTLSDSRFKKYNITGENNLAKDLFNFFDQGQTSKDLVFEVSSSVKGETQSAENFSGQYDFFYGSGANVLADKNYTEDFRYFAPLWLKSEIPDFFVIFKTPGPLNYPYSQNATNISSGVVYKVIQDFDSDGNFVINYGKNAAGADVFYAAGETFIGNSNYTGYSIISGSGKIAIFDELAYISLSDDVQYTFENKILPNCSVIKTFDLRENTKIGKYIRQIFNNPGFSNSPIEVSWGLNSYSYFKGVSYADGVYTRKAELLTEFLSSSSSDPMIDFEDYVTSGFSRNGVICPNLLNLEFLFNDDESENFTINRYFGFYVSRNDFAKFRLNGNFFYEYRNIQGNENYPQPSINNVGYYDNNYSDVIAATSGVRIFYEDASGFLPGSDNVNLYDSNKIFYVTDKYDNFYTLKRSETYTQAGGSGPEYTYGPYDYSLGQFTATGSSGATSGSFVLGNSFVDLLSFTGNDDPIQKIGTVSAEKTKESGKAYIDIKFLKNYDLPNPLTFKIFWPNGSQKEGSRKFDIVRSGDFSAILRWVGGSYYSSGNSYYFNAETGTTGDVARAFSDVLKDVDDIIWDTGSNGNYSIIRVTSSGTFGNDNFSITAFDNYSAFTQVYKGTWSNISGYTSGDVVLYNNNYFEANINIPASSSSLNTEPGGTVWNPYNTFSSSGYVEICGVDASEITSNSLFRGGTILPNNRIIFPLSDSNIIQPGYFIPTVKGYVEVNQITRYVDSPIKSTDTEKVISFENFETLLVANLKNDYAEVDLGTDKSVSIYSTSNTGVGVFTFFDTKEFDFDFWSSDYSYNPNPETFRYFQILADTDGVIYPNSPYFVKSGQIVYSGTLYNQGQIFYGATGSTSFQNINPGPDSYPVVFPAQFSDVTFDSSATSYSNIGYYKDFEAFLGFIGIQDLFPGTLKQSASKEQAFELGKLATEYDYLKENYTTSRSNISRIVPYINKWGYSGGLDARGNQYRLNSSPAFSPLNFSPSLERILPDPKYLNHEWFLLEQPPIDFPVEFMNSQKSYLPGKIDLNKLIDADPANSLYTSSYFTVEPQDYSQDYRDLRSYTKELFTPLVYNQASGYYETLFRGVKVVFKKRSSLASSETDSLNRYIQFSRSYEGYNFSAIIRAIPEDSTTIQSPIKYQFIENTQQKFIVFICDLVVKDQRVFEIGYTGGTGGNPILDYTTLYSMSDKTKLTYPLFSGQDFTTIDTIKLSCGLDLSLSSGSYVTTTSSGRINIVENPDYDTDLREEINTFFVENTVGATAGLSPTGLGSFNVPTISSTYPWPIGIGPKFVQFGLISTTSNYTFSIPFATSTPAEVPVGPSSIYKTSPVFQVSGGSKYFSSLLNRVTVSYISKIANARSPYIKYRTFSWDSLNSVTVEKSDDFEVYFESPTRILKPLGTSYSESFEGPQELKGNSVASSYVLRPNQPNLPSTLLRYSGGYEPLFRKVIFFDLDKSDTIFGSGSLIDLSFRNCNFAPNKYYFGVSRNLSYTKVSLGNQILALSSKFPEGAVYPLINQTPIAKKDFNLFSSSWDPGYYERYLNAKDFERVAGTRSMTEYNTFFGSKIMQTPDPVLSYNYITLQISRTSGTTSVEQINNEIFSAIYPVQNISSTNSGTGVGRIGPYLSPVDFNKIDPNIFPSAEVIWQYFPDTLTVSGTLRLDRVLRRQLLNSGVKKEFINNMISDFGVGNPDSIDDDVIDYIEANVVPIYEGNQLNLYVKKNGSETLDVNLLIRGDIYKSDLLTSGYVLDPNFKLTQNSNLIYDFSFQLEKSYSYSLQFNFYITKL